jgi:hypothetical protein
MERRSRHDVRTELSRRGGRGQCSRHRVRPVGTPVHRLRPHPVRPCSQGHTARPLARPLTCRQDERPCPRRECPESFIRQPRGMRSERPVVSNGRCDRLPMLSFTEPLASDCQGQRVERRQRRGRLGCVPCDCVQPVRPAAITVAGWHEDRRRLSMVTHPMQERTR